MLKVLLYVQHLVGTGHLSRSLAIAKGMAAAGMHVKLVSGGRPVPNLDMGEIELIQLPPAYCRAGEFGVLLDNAGQPVSPRWEVSRTRALLAVEAQFNPDVMIVESFPLGRRRLSFELLPLLAQSHAIKLCSIRDVLQTGRKATRIQESLERLNRYFDGLLIHGDMSVFSLAESFPAANQITVPIYYTGYVVQADAHMTNSTEASGEILVSAGGGAVGEQLFDTAQRCWAAGFAAPRAWRFLASEQLASIIRHRDARLNVEVLRRDFFQMLKRCAVSVSQAGYNTATEVVAAGCQSVLIPYAQHGETEQTMRAKRWHSLGFAEYLSPNALSPARLGRAIENRLTAYVSQISIDLKGVAYTAQLVRNLYATRDSTR